MAADLDTELRILLAKLRALSEVAEAEQVRRSVADLADRARALDANIPAQYETRVLYDYVEWRSRAALGHEIRWLAAEQAAIDRALLVILDVAWAGRSADEIRLAQQGLTELRARLDQLELGADRSQALRSLADYVAAQSQLAVESATFSARQHTQVTQSVSHVQHGTYRTFRRGR